MNIYIEETNMEIMKNGKLGYVGNSYSLSNCCNCCVTIHTSELIKSHSSLGKSVLDCFAKHC